jgi:hypothetical protein
MGILGSRSTTIGQTHYAFWNLPLKNKDLCKLPEWGHIGDVIVYHEIYLGYNA